MENASPVVPGPGRRWRLLAAVQLGAIAAPVLSAVLGADPVVIAFALGGGVIVAAVVLVVELVGLRDRMPAIARFGLPPVVDEAEERRRLEEWNRGYAVVGQITVGLLVVGGPLAAFFGAPRLGGATITLPTEEVLSALLLGSGLLIGMIPFALFAWRAAKPRAAAPGPADPRSLPAAPTMKAAVARGVFTTAAGVAVSLWLSLRFGETSFGIATSIGVVVAGSLGTWIGYWRQRTVYQAALAAAGTPLVGHSGDGGQAAG